MEYMNYAQAIALVVSKDDALEHFVEHLVCYPQSSHHVRHYGNSTLHYGGQYDGDYERFITFAHLIARTKKELDQDLERFLGAFPILSIQTYQTRPDPFFFYVMGYDQKDTLASKEKLPSPLQPKLYVVGEAASETSLFDS